MKKNQVVSVLPALGSSQCASGFLAQTILHKSLVVLQHGWSFD